MQQLADAVSSRLFSSSIACFCRHLTRHSEGYLTGDLRTADIPAHFHLPVSLSESTLVFTFSRALTRACHAAQSRSLRSLLLMQADHTLDARS